MHVLTLAPHTHRYQTHLIDINTHTRTNTHAHTYARTHIHAHIHTHTYIHITNNRCPSTQRLTNTHAYINKNTSQTYGMWQVNIRIISQIDLHLARRATNCAVQHANISFQNCVQAIASMFVSTIEIYSIYKCQLYVQIQDVFVPSQGRPFVI